MTYDPQPPDRYRNRVHLQWLSVVGSQVTRLKSDFSSEQKESANA